MVDVADLEFEANVPEAVRRLHETVDLLFVVSNQPDVARGTQTREANEALNAAIARALPIRKFYTCYHDDADRCSCRKPLPGLLTAAAEEFAVDLRASFLVGDRWRDVDAGAAAGCTTIFIDRKYDERPPSNSPDFTFASTDEAVAALCDALLRGDALQLGEV